MGVGNVTESDLLADIELQQHARLIVEILENQIIARGRIQTRGLEIAGRVGGAVVGSSGQWCLGYRPRSSLRTSGYPSAQNDPRSSVT